MFKFDLNKYFEAYAYRDVVMMRPPIICKSGIKLSVQASSFHGCIPRNDTGPYTTVEVGIINRATEELDTVETYVPVWMVERIIRDHGGIDLVEILVSLSGEEAFVNEDEMEDYEISYFGGELEEDNDDRLNTEYVN